MIAVGAATAAIRLARSAADVALARELFVEYARSLDYDLCFQGFDDELATLPGAYAAPQGRLLVVGEPGAAFGCIALRPLMHAPIGGASRADTRVVAGAGEVKRLFVRDAHRAAGWGRRLAQTIVDEARAIGYRELKLDTLESMRAARSLYASLGFTPCAPYYDNPLPGALYMSVTLDGAR